MIRRHSILLSCAVVCLALAGNVALAADATEEDAAAAQTTDERNEYPLDVLGSDLEDLSWTPGLVPDAPVAELDEAYAPRVGYFKVPGVSRGTDYVSDRLDELDKNFGIRIRTAYTMLFQNLSGGSWDESGGAGDFDLMMSWTAIGRGTENTGRLVADFEDRHEIGNRTPNALGGQVATLQPTANTFNDRGWVVRDVLWTQRLYEGQLRFMIGRADSTDYFGSTWMQSANNS